MKDKELIRLQKIWYNKLKEKGFKDIEYFDCNMEPRDMMQNTSPVFASNDPVLFRATEQYYIDAEHLLNSYKFPNKIHKKIWKYHIEGLSYRKIMNILNLKYNFVYKIVNIYKTVIEAKYV